jgi:hypothetical protein
MLAIALLGGGCGTLQNVNCPAVAPADNPNAPVCRVYGGARGDWAIISEYPLSESPSYADYVVIPVMAAGHLVFDVIGDTVTLPYTAVEEVRRAFYRPSASSEFSPMIVPVTLPATPAPPTTSPTTIVPTGAKSVWPLKLGTSPTLPGNYFTVLN